jgi:hypothetical protein
VSWDSERGCGATAWRGREWPESILAGVAAAGAWRVPARAFASQASVRRVAPWATREWHPRAKTVGVVGLADSARITKSVGAAAREWPRPGGIAPWIPPEGSEAGSTALPTGAKVPHRYHPESEAGVVERQT